MLFQFRRRHHAGHQPRRQCRLRVERRTLPDHDRRLHQRHQPGDALGTAKTGHQAELDLGQAELQPGIIRDEPCVTGQRHFQSAAQGMAIDRGNKGFA
jgi:hypothetical protein